MQPQESNRKTRILALAIAGIVALSLAVLLYRYRGHLFFALDLADEATGSRAITVLGLALVLLVLACVVLWMVFPLIVYLRLKDLSRRTAALDQTMRLCAHHLTQLTTDRNTPTTNPAPEEKSPGGESS